MYSLAKKKIFSGPIVIKLLKKTMKSSGKFLLS